MRLRRTTPALIIALTLLAQANAADKFPASAVALADPARAVDEKLPIKPTAEVSAGSAAFDSVDDASVESSASTPQRQLSVAPSDPSLLPEDRPAWVGSAPDLTGAQHRIFVGSFPTNEADEADQQLDEPLVAALMEYLNAHVLPKPQASHLQISSNFIRHNLLDSRSSYLARLTSSSGPLYQKWVILEITPEQRNHFLSLFHQSQQRERMAMAGLVALSLFGGTALVNLTLRTRNR